MADRRHELLLRFYNCN